MSATIERSLTINDCAGLCRCRPDDIRIAAVTGALPAIDQGPGQRGRRPRFLIQRADLLAWLAAGKPTAPVGAA
jgi:hypothetical protein